MLLVGLTHAYVLAGAASVVAPLPSLATAQIYASAALQFSAVQCSALLLYSTTMVKEAPLPLYSNRWQTPRLQQTVPPGGQAAAGAAARTALH